MSRDVMLGQNNLRFLYYRYKDSQYVSLGLVVLVVSVCLMLFSRVVIPQFENWFSIRNEVVETNARIDAIKSNINFMQNLDKSQLNTQAQIASSALPTEKDFGAMLNALSDAAVHAGVSLEDFTFQVGNIASASGSSKT